MENKKESDTELEKPDDRAQDSADEQTADETESDSQEPSAGDDTVEELTTEEMLQRRVAELEDRLLRAAADFDNYRKRAARQYEDLLSSANDQILSDLLEVVDNFERALEHSNNSSDIDVFRKGAELILNQMNDLLKKYNVTPVEALGKAFDPNLHDAMMEVDSDEYDKGLVAMVVSKGYRRGERIIRHSKVGVSKGKKQ